MLEEQLFNNKCVSYIKNEGVEYIQFNNLKKYEPRITHCFTTKHGGVSTGEFTSLNLGFNRNDIKDNVEENYRRISKALGISHENMVFSNQVHEDKIYFAGLGDRGKGILRGSDIIGYDGLVTDKEEVVLVTFFADCVPIFLYDPEKAVISLVHSGWRGTVKEISKKAVRKMVGEFGCKAADIEAAIGPSIARCCFETGEEVYLEFVNNMEWSTTFCSSKGDGKWYIDLQGIINRSLINAGLQEDKICLSGICTKCNSDIFYSHRASEGKRGSLAAIMQINKS